MKTRQYIPLLAVTSLLAAAGTGCNNARPQQAAAGPQALPVQTMTAEAVPVPQSDEYVATIKSRNSATINPQVDGNITQILVHSGEQVRPGQILMEIDASKQEATVASQAATADQKLAVYNYDKLQVERQRKLFADGIISKDALDQAEQAYANSKADYDSEVESLHMQQKQLGYYKIAAPFDGIVGDVPVHVGDYVSSTTLLTTVDQNRDLEAYVYVPTERASEVRRGLPVNILDNSGNLIEKTAIDFVSPQVDDTLQGILVKAPVHSKTLRNDQLVEAQVIWGTAPHPVVPVLAVSRLGGQAFVFVAQSAGTGKFIARQQAVTLGNTVGNEYAVLNGLKDGDKVIVSGTQFLVDGVPVIPLPPAPASAAAHAGG
ncbi:MAG TPA: efflux RND transporter periplasmic adaptor subunit [Acidobacteriaceae bacterium]|nr:efflux RND transporter periplasmic adaptor subunit [Acidobacteriaceae bacterium]